MEWSISVLSGNPDCVSSVDKKER